MTENTEIAGFNQSTVLWHALSRDRLYEYPYKLYTSLETRVHMLQYDRYKYACTGEFSFKLA